MYRIFFRVAALLCFLFQTQVSSSKDAVWGADYFPNHVLTSHEGKQKRFFDDLIKDKVVVINFIYTTCPDVCPMETAQMAQVSRILGERVGKDVHFISITIDPETDTPEILDEYRTRFRANWPFYTGSRSDIIDLRRKLGLYVEDLGGGENNHNVNLIIGNQKTGRWMKRTPFENPYVLADQVGNWLHGWKAVQHKKDFAAAPELRSVSDGENLFRTRCASCHTLDGSRDRDAIGPDLLAVTINRDRAWLIEWMRNPEKMILAKDTIAVSLYNRYNKIMMPDMNLGKEDIADLLDYIDLRTEQIMMGRLRNQNTDEKDENSDRVRPTMIADARTGGDTVAIMNSWVREALPGAGVNAGYMTLFNVGEGDVTLTKIESDSFEMIEIHRMVSVDGMMEMTEIEELFIAAGSSETFEPGGKHLMMMDPTKDFIEGETIELTLTFASGSTQIITMPVIKK